MTARWNEGFDRRPLGVVKSFGEDDYGVFATGYFFPPPRHRGLWHRLCIWWAARRP